MKHLLAIHALALACGSTLLSAEINIFSFDDHAIPYKLNLKLTLEHPKKFPGNPVVRRGPPGSVDAFRAQFYGSVIHIGNKFRMWYLAASDAEAVNSVDASFRLAYAESDDGIRWSKPELGLTEFHGNKRNNLVEVSPAIDMRRLGPLSCFVLYEPQDPDPHKRYKMAVYARYYESADPKEVARARNIPSTMLPLFSADGFHWRLAIPAPKGPWFTANEVPFPVKNNFELGGLYKFDGIYYVAGQELWPDINLPDGSPVRRTMVTHWSGNFIDWSHDKSFSFQRHGYRSVRESLEEAHEPAGAWNRGNVLVALYGLWHGALVNSERRMDLGLLVSDDGIHFREPVADFPFIPAGRDGEWDQRGLIHGQGYVNVGEQTYIYYGNWDLSRSDPAPGEVGLAMMRRDGFGYLSPIFPGEAQFTTAPLASAGPKASLYCNVDGLGPESWLKVEVIDKLGAPIIGLSGAGAPVVQQSGLKVQVTERSGAPITLPAAPFRLRVRFEGASSGKARFYAAYVE